MLQFNQTKNALKWSMSGQVFDCEPWGSIDLDAEQAAASLSRGLPLGPAPVAPEVRAQRRLAEEAEDADKQAFQALKREADEAKAAAKDAKERLELSLVELAEAKDATRKANAEIASLKQRVTELEADRTAAEQLIQETSKAAAESEAKAIKAEALSKKKPGRGD